MMNVTFSFVFLICFNVFLLSASKCDENNLLSNFLKAAKNGNFSALKACIQEGVDPNEMPKALVLAIENEHLYMVDKLLMEENLVVPNDVLHHVVASKNTSMLERLLLDPRIDVNFENSSRQSPLQTFFEKEMIEMFLMLLKDPRVDVNKGDGSLRTVLHCAAIRNDSGLVSEILKRQDVNINSKDLFGQTALYYAIRKSRSKNALELLHDHRIDFEAVHDIGISTFNHSIRMGFVEVVQRLVEINPNWEIFENNNSIQLARRYMIGNIFKMEISTGNPLSESLKRLIENEPDLNIRNSAGQSLLEMIFESGKHEIIDFLLDQNSDYIRNNVLMVAVAKRKRVIIPNLLVDLRVNINYMDENGISALIVAIRSNLTEIAMMLIDNPRIEVNIPENPALHTAISFNRGNILVELIKRGKVDKNLRDKEGHTALFFAISNKKEELALELLRSYDTAVNVESDIGESALHIAIKRGYLKVVRALISSNVNLDFIDNKGKTALKYALMKGNREILAEIEAHLGSSLK